MQNLLTIYLPSGLYINSSQKVLIYLFNLFLSGNMIVDVDQTFSGFFISLYILYCMYDLTCQLKIKNE